MEAFADVVEEYAPLNKGHITTRQNIQIHHVPLRDMAELIRKVSDSGLSSREGCGNTVRNVTGDPWAGVCEGELFDITPYAGAYVRYFVRHPTTQLMPRKIKTAFTATDEDRAITGIHDIAFIPRVRDGVRGVEIRVGGGTSIMPRVAPTLYDFVELDNGDYLKVSEAVLPHLRPPGLAARQPRPRPHQGADRQDRHRRVPRAGRGGAQGRLGRPSATSTRRRSCSRTTRRRTRPQRRADYAQPNGDVAEFERFRASNVQPQRQEGFSTVQVRVIRGDLTPEQFRGLAQIMRDYSGGYARTTVEQNLVLRWVRDEAVYEVWQRARRARASATAGADEIIDTVELPGHRQLQARHHELDGPQPRGAGARGGDGHRRRAHQADPHQDVRLPERLQPAPHRQHRLLRRVDQGRRQDDPGLRRRTSAASYEGGEVVYGTRLKVRLPAKRVPDAVERWLRIYEARARGGRGVQRLRRARRQRSASRSEVKRPVAARRVQPREHELLHRLAAQGALPGDPRRGRVRGLSAAQPPPQIETLSAEQLATVERTTRGWRSPAPSRRRSRC